MPIRPSVVDGNGFLLLWKKKILGNAHLAAENGVSKIMCAAIF
jgi:hypothetical protein